MTFRLNNRPVHLTDGKTEIVDNTNYGWNVKVRQDGREITLPNVDAISIQGEQTVFRSMLHGTTIGLNGITHISAVTTDEIQENKVF